MLLGIDVSAIFADEGNLNFVHWGLSECLAGLKEACMACHVYFRPCRRTDSKGGTFCVLLLIIKMEFADGYHASAQHVEWHVLVGRVDGVAFQSETHEYRFDA